MPPLNRCQVRRWRWPHVRWSGWWRGGYCGGQQAWVPDEKRGRFGWYFDIVEKP